MRKTRVSGREAGADAVGLGAQVERHLGPAGLGEGDEVVDRAAAAAEDPRFADQHERVGAELPEAVRPQRVPDRPRRRRAEPAQPDERLHERHVLEPGLARGRKRPLGGRGDPDRVPLAIVVDGQRVGDGHARTLAERRIARCASRSSSPSPCSPPRPRRPACGSSRRSTRRSTPTGLRSGCSSPARDRR